MTSEAKPVGVLCLGCGSHWDDERLAGEKAKRPDLISCCPERKMVPVYTAPPSTEALREENERLKAAVDEHERALALSGKANVALMAENERLTRRVDAFEAGQEAHASNAAYRKRLEDALRDEKAALAAAEAEVKRLREALKHVEDWWLGEGMKHFNGAPYAMFAARAALSPSPDA